MHFSMSDNTVKLLEKIYKSINTVDSMTETHNPIFIEHRTKPFGGSFLDFIIMHCWSTVVRCCKINFWVPTKLFSEQKGELYVFFFRVFVYWGERNSIVKVILFSLMYICIVIFSYDKRVLLRGILLLICTLNVAAWLQIVRSLYKK